MFMNTDSYNRENPISIYEYSKNLLGKSIREWRDTHPDISDVVEEKETPAYGKSHKKGKGDLGQKVERYFFNYEPNNSPLPDFPEAGLELKCTGLIESKDGKKFSVKERLVCDMINYMEDANLSFEQSKFYIKCLRMLVMFYLYKKGLDSSDYKFLKVALWKLPAKDLLIIRRDYETILGKILSGHAEDISESDTLYLAACRKGSGGEKDLTPQPYSNVLAYRRAFSLKPSYIRTIVEYVDNHGGIAASNFKEEGEAFQLVSEEELKSKSFNEIIISRFERFYGKNYNEIVNELGIRPSIAKSKYALLASEIVRPQDAPKSKMEKYDEFKKSGITMKTIRVNNTGSINEAMSFENINYEEIYENDIWEESRLYEILTTQFLFVIFKEDKNGTKIQIKDKEEPEFKLCKVLFWKMPKNDLDDAKLYWENIRKNVMENTIHLDNFYHISDHKKFHVRPKGTKSSYKNAALNPHGGKVDKYCYWFNIDYVKQIIDTVL